VELQGRLVTRSLRPALQERRNGKNRIRVRGDYAVAEGNGEGRD
jgi:hypothetical protein